jgi:hypothetical protein
MQAPLHASRITTRRSAPGRHRPSAASHASTGADAGSLDLRTRHRSILSTQPGTGRQAALVAGASISHRAKGGEIWPDGGGMPDHQPQAAPSNQAGTRAGHRRRLDRERAGFVGSAACPGGLAACQGVHRCPVPSWRRWPTGWSRHELSRWRTGRGPSTDQRSSRWENVLVAEAEEVGFEPTGPSRVRRLSRSLPSSSSATPPRVVYGLGGGIRAPWDLH